MQPLQALLSLDPALDARDRSGAGALFCACYAGYEECVAVLLAAGANTALTNTQGESCLYIAALRGHTPVVDCLLQHLTAKGLPWMVRHCLCSRFQAVRVLERAPCRVAGVVLLHPRPVKLVAVLVLGSWLCAASCVLLLHTRRRRS